MCLRFKHEFKNLCKFGHSYSRKQVNLKARHIPGCLSVAVDELSRLGQIIETEWSFLLVNMVAPPQGGSVENEVQQQGTSVCVTSSRLPSQGSRCSQSAFGGPRPIYLPTSGHSGQTGGGANRLLVQENHLDCSGLAQHALVVGCSGYFRPNLLTQSFNQIPHNYLAYLNLYAWLLEPQLSRSEVS